MTEVTIVRPGDRVLLVVPKTFTPEDADRILREVKRFAPDAKWLLVSGIETIFHRPAELDFPHGQPASCAYCKGNSAVRKPDGELMTSQEWCADTGKCAASIDWDHAREATRG